MRNALVLPGKVVWVREETESEEDRGLTKAGIRWPNKMRSGIDSVRHVVQTLAQRERERE